MIFMFMCIFLVIISLFLRYSGMIKSSSIIWCKDDL
jgi:hypothetical protein